ncbi:MAG: sulfite exporter TauE/SafE family protein [Verrucomicrobiia bacterium]
MEVIWLCVFAFLAGLLDSMVGGGGLIQIPALFLFLPESDATAVATVLGTNKLSSMCGTAMAAFQYSRRIDLHWQTIIPAAITAFLFSFFGALVVARLQPAMAKPFVLILLVAVAAYTFFHHDIGDRDMPGLKSRTATLFAVSLGAAIGFYDGFFGPGTGSFLIFCFVSIFGCKFIVASASAKFVNLATNLSAVAFFAATNHILYRYALPMGLCNIAGAVAGTHCAILKGNRFVRRLFLLTVTALILRYGWEVLTQLFHH